MKTLLPKLRYRPEVDGLRAIAVLLVILYHARFGCHGGYVGVDVFFVISGFLITSLIWNDLESGRFTFAQFWERRARRIAPALIAVTIATLAAGWFLMLPIDLEKLGRASASQAVLAANIYYWRVSDYFAGTADQKPLLHTWSLAVEEQFYLLVPIVLWAMFRCAALRSRAAVLTALAVESALSFAISVYGVGSHPQAAFFLLPTRAWELSLGALVAFLPAPSLRIHRWVRELLSLAGICLVFAAAFAYSPQTPLPGLAALPPCLGTSLLIWANGRGDGPVPTYLGKALSYAPLVFIGSLSYSLYLWHWPLLTFSRYTIPTDLSAGDRVAIVALGFLCAVLSWRYVETPFRKRTLAASRRSMFAVAGAGLAAVFAGGLLCMRMQGFPQRLSPEARKLADARTDMSFINELTTEDVKSGRLVSIGEPDRALQPALLVWGDSHAMATLPAIDALLKERHLSGRAATHPSTAPILGWFMAGTAGLNEGALAFNDHTLSYIRQRRVPLVLLAAFWSSYAQGNQGGAGGFAARLLATVRQLTAIGAHPLVMLDVPIHNFDVPTALARTRLSGALVKQYCTRPTAANALDGIPPQVIAGIEQAGGRVVDPKPAFLSPDGQYYMVERDGIVLYRDGQHLTTCGAKLVLLPFLREALKAEGARLAAHSAATGSN